MSAEVTLTEDERAELVSAVSNALRVADGDHAMGTGALAEVAVDRIADWLAARVEQARAEVLRETADAWTQGAWSDVMLPQPAPPAVPVIAYANRLGDWLRDRADREGGPS